MTISVSTTELLDQLRIRGVKLWLEADRLRYNAPKGVMSDDVLRELKSRKQEIILALSQPAVEKATEVPELAPIPRDAELPLSYAQKRIWFLDQMEPDSAFYNVALAKKIAGSLDVGLLRESLTLLIERHEVLRSVCTTVNNEAVLNIATKEEISAGTDWFRHTELPADINATDLQHLVDEEASRPLSLAVAPLLRCRLFSAGADAHVLVFTTHHFAVDGWSCGLLMRDLSTIYAALENQSQPELPTLPVQYVDFAAWQSQWLQGEELERQSAFWKTQLSGAATLSLPTDRPHPPLQSFRGGIHNFKIPREITDGLKKLSRERGVTLYMTLLAAFQTLLHRYSNQDDIVIGTAVSNRHSSDLENLMGPFLNTLVLRGDLSDNPNFGELVDRARDLAADAFAHQDLPFELLVEQLKPERDRSRSPLFQVLFVVHQYDQSEELAMNGRAVVDYPVELGTTMYDMFLQLIQLDDDLSGSIEYSTDLFDRATISRFTDHFQYLLSSIVANPATRIGDLRLLDVDEQQLMLTRWNDTACEYPRDKTLHRLFAEQAARSPQSPAVSCAGNTCTYIELEQRSNQLANFLCASELTPDRLIGVYMERSVDMMVALLGVLKAGCAYVPLDPAFPASRIEYMMDDADMPVILTQEDLSEAISQSSARRICIDSDWSAIAEHPDSLREELADPEQLAYVIYTSGSTGQPKGVQIPHRAVVNFLWTMIDKPGISSGDNMLAVTTLSFDIAVLELFMPLMIGAHSILAPRDVSADGARLADLIAASDATIMQATPATWQLLLNADWPGNPDLKILCGGEALPRTLADRIIATGSELWNMYGPTETTIWSSLSRIKDEGPIDIGYPIANTQMYIVDSNDQPVPVGVAGELCIAGDGLARGYFKRDDLTAEKFVANPFADDNARMYRTGDLARYRPDGSIECLGRNDHQVKLRGYRMELGEIELALSRHNAVREAIVAARENREGDKRLVGYLIANTSNISSDDMARWKNEQMSQWQDLWQDAYSRQAGAIDPAFDISGWLSSYTGEQIPAAQMREWIEATADRINELKPEKVLEIGCGTGLVVARVAPYCKEFTGIDFSPAAIQAVETLRETRIDLKHVRVLQRAATELDDFDTAAYDMVVINSVAQYFPDVDYLLELLQRAARLVRPGGTIFLGDIRSLPLLDDYHTSVQFFQAEGSLPVAELAERIRQRTEQEEELLLDPSFFIALQESSADISGLRFQLKRGTQRNELTRFRYDVVLRVGGSKDSTTPPEKIDWNLGQLSLSDIKSRLDALPDNGLLISGIPDARLAEEVSVAKSFDQNSEQSVAELRRQIGAQTRNDIEVEDVYQLAGQYGLDIQTIGAAAGHFNVLLKPAEQSGYADAQWLVQGSGASLQQYANDPLKGRLQRSLIPMLREQLRETLPEYMVPSAFVLLDKFPLTPNGKIDRNALPEPDHSLTQRYVPPDTPTQEALVSIWENVLGANQVGINDDFFELGGHSLLATQLISRIRDTLNVTLPLNALFDFPTVAGLAEPVDSLLWALNQNDDPQNGDEHLEEVEI